MQSLEPVPPPRVVVLMSTYNGERFVVEQLHSILQQLPEGGRINVRDDGSSDGTVAKIEGIEDPRISVSRGTNLGFGQSFLTLLSEVPAEADLIMFSDQDDVWLPGKISRAWQHLEPLGETPGLYGSSQMLVDAELRSLHATPLWPRGPSLRNALTENIITGCTAALNRAAVQRLRHAGVPNGVHFHDWWLYLVISAFGTVIYDERPTLLYRQHGRNQIGHGAGWFGRHVGIGRFLLRNDWVGILLEQVAALVQHYEASITPAHMQLIRDHFHIRGLSAVPRWRMIFGPHRSRQGRVSEMAFRLLLVMHRLHLWPPQGRRIRPRA